MPEKTAQKEPGKKPVPSKKPKPQQEVVIQIPLSELHPFPDHPFKVRDDEAMQETAESIRQYGVLVPAIVRPREDGGYEIIAGHRRRHGSELAGLSAMPCIVRQMDDDTATILMVDSNIQRENILPSERAQAYKMKLEAIKRQGARTDLRGCLKTIFQNRSRQPLFLAHAKEKATNYTPKTVHKTRGAGFASQKSVLFFFFIRYAAPGTNRWFPNRPVCILWCSFSMLKAILTRYHSTATPSTA